MWLLQELLVTSIYIIEDDIEKIAESFLQPTDSKIVEKLQILPQAGLQELKFISEFIGDLDSIEEVQNNIIGHIQKKRFPTGSQNFWFWAFPGLNVHAIGLPMFCCM